MAKSPKSDIDAKAAFAKHLVSNGYTDVRIAREPADVIAKKGRKTFYFEVKSSSKDDGEGYFGSITMREWQHALSLKNYFFVIVWQKNKRWQFKMVTPEEMQRIAYLARSPLAFFNLPLNHETIAPKKATAKSVKATDSVISRIGRFYDRIFARQKNSFRD